MTDNGSIDNQAAPAGAAKPKHETMKFTINLDEITITEWRTMFDIMTTNDERDRIISQVTGLSIDEIRKLRFRDYQAMTAAIREEAGKPLANPN